MWIRSRARFRGASASGVTAKARAPPTVVFSNRTRRRAHKSGRRAIAGVASKSTSDFQASPVAGRMFQEGLKGAPISACISGLTVVGTGADERSAIMTSSPGLPRPAR